MFSADFTYHILCLSGCGEHFATDDAEAAWDEATAHERALGHETRVVSYTTAQRRKLGGARDSLGARAAIRAATEG